MDQADRNYTDLKRRFADLDGKTEQVLQHLRASKGGRDVPRDVIERYALLPSADGDGKVSGCATTGTRPVGLWALLLPLLVMGRRRSA